MKAHVYDMKGISKKEVTLPRVFDTPIRKDLVMKAVEVLREFQQHSLDPRAGRRHSAAGTISHKRHDWKGHYGKGMSRIPRKIMWRRGVQFNWVGAEISGTRGGRRVHGPKLVKRIRYMNAKEMKYAFHSALAASAQTSYIQSRYQTLATKEVKAPVIVALEGNPKMKDWLAFMKKVFGSLSIAVQHSEIRAGKGKARGRKYKSNAGALVVIGPKEELVLSGVDIRKVNELTVSDLYPLGRLTIYTEQAMEALAK